MRGRRDNGVQRAGTSPRTRAASGIGSLLTLAGGAFLLTMIVGTPGTQASSAPPSKYDNGQRIGALPPKDLEPLTDPARV